VIVQLCFGTNNSGHFSHTIYDCHQYTSHHQALNGEETKFRAELAAFEIQLQTSQTKFFAEFHASLIEFTIDITVSLKAFILSTIRSIQD
jgi:hypothetical protein